MKEERIRLSHKSPRKGGAGVCPQLPGGVPRPLARGRGASRRREEPGACFCLLGSADLWPPGAAALLFRRGRRLRQDDYVFFPFEGFFTVSSLANTWAPLAFILSRQRRFPALPL